jgi:hypothetical protein
MLFPKRLKNTHFGPFSALFFESIHRKIVSVARLCGKNGQTARSHCIPNWFWRPKKSLDIFVNFVQKTKSLKTKKVNFPTFFSAQIFENPEKYPKIAPGAGKNAGCERLGH